MPEPGLLALCVLPSADGNGFGHRFPRSFSVQVLHCLTNPDSVEARCPGIMPLCQNCGNFLDEAAPDHLVRAARDPLVEHRPGCGENNVPWVERSPSPCGLLPVGERTSAEKGNFDGPCGTLPASTAKAGIQPGSPAQQLDRLETGGPRVERTPLGGIEWRLGKQPFGERPHVQPGSAHDNRKVAPASNLFQPFHRVAREVTGAVALPRLDQIHAMVRNARPLFSGRLRRADVEAAVDLA
jgi:hypothetical protein